jgi:alkanesulfonate monooxygenase SsuD/methylene tetrahydromethanopterin reductase-like flavin-dependent oxidoreductase (luciferase family)
MRTGQDEIGLNSRPGVDEIRLNTGGPRYAWGCSRPGSKPLVGWPEYVATARAADEGGYSSVWLGDHLL